MCTRGQLLYQNIWLPSVSEIGILRGGQNLRAKKWFTDYTFVDIARWGAVFLTYNAQIVGESTMVFNIIR